MLSTEQLDHLREDLEKYQNPVIFYDNDADGFCSYVLLRKYLGRGKGTVIRSHPDIDVRYAHKVVEFNADCVIILDRPLIGQKFLDALKEYNVPVIWIDHHKTDEELDYPHLTTYNPLHGDHPSEEPVVYWTYKLTRRSEDVWIALMGCIADHYLPDFAKDFTKEHPEYWGSVEKPFDAYYGTELGHLAQSISFGLKDSLSHVVSLQAFFVGCTGIEELRTELEGSSAYGKKYREIKKKYLSLLEEVRADNPKLVFFTYGGDLSISADLANELSYRYPDRIIIVAYTKGSISNLSLRGKHVRAIFEKVIGNFESASGGGHEEAVGARMRTEDIERFKKAIEEVLTNGRA